MPDESDPNNGYECDGNSGIARGNPAHTACVTPNSVCVEDCGNPPPPDCVKDCGNPPPPDCVKDCDGPPSPERTGFASSSSPARYGFA